MIAMAIILATVIALDSRDLTPLGLMQGSAQTLGPFALWFLVPQLGQALVRRGLQSSSLPGWARAVILMLVLIALVTSAFLIGPRLFELSLRWVVLAAVVASLSQTLVRSLISWKLHERLGHYRLVRT